MYSFPARNILNDAFHSPIGNKDVLITYAAPFGPFLFMSLIPEFSRTMAGIVTNSPRRFDTLKRGFEQIGVPQIIQVYSNVDEEKVIRPRVEDFRSISPASDIYTTAMAEEKLLAGMWGFRPTLFTDEKQQAAIRKAQEQRIDHIVLVGGDSMQEVLNIQTNEWEPFHKGKTLAQAARFALAQADRHVRINAGLAVLAVPIDKLLPNAFNTEANRQADMWLQISNTLRRKFFILTAPYSSRYNVGLDRSFLILPSFVRTLTKLRHDSFGLPAVRDHYAYLLSIGLDPRSIAGGIDTSSFDYIDQRIPVETTIYDYSYSRRRKKRPERTRYENAKMYEKPYGKGVVSVFSAQPEALDTVTQAAIHNLNEGRTFWRAEELEMSIGRQTLNLLLHQIFYRKTRDYLNRF